MSSAESIIVLSRTRFGASLASERGSAGVGDIGQHDRVAVQPLNNLQNGRSAQLGPRPGGVNRRRHPPQYGDPLARLQDRFAKAELKVSAEPGLSPDVVPFQQLIQAGRRA